MSTRTQPHAQPAAVNKVEAGILLGVGYNVLQKLIANGTLRTVQIGTCRAKVTCESIDAVLAKTKRSPKKSA